MAAFRPVHKRARGSSLDRHSTVRLQLKEATVPA